MTTPARVLSLVLCLVLLAPARAQEAPERWTPELSMRFKSIPDVALSPDGRLVAYVVREAVMDGEQSEYRSHVWVVSADGRLNVQYTRGDKSCTDPAFSPDGQYLAFTSDRSGKNQVWVMRVDGGEAEQVTDAETGVAAYRWSPDGTRIAYTARDPETEAEKTAKKEKRYVEVVDRDFKYNHLYVVPLAKDADGERPARRLTAGTFHVTSFDWSPDGRTLVFAHQPDPTINTGFVERDLATVPADSGAVTPLVTWAGVDDTPRFSPDGAWVAFVSDGGRPERVGLGDLYVVPAGGGEPRRLADTPDRNATLLGWSADGTELFATEAVRTTRQVLAVPVDGSPTRQLTTFDGVVGSVAFDRATAWMAYTFEDLDTPEEVYLGPVGGVERTRLTSVNAALPRPPMGRTELLTWTAPDGLKIDGLLTYPVGYEPGRAYPLILQIHGGPAGVFSQRFTGAPGIYMTQVFAQAGYAVLRPNPRGSTGYGKDFRYANVRDWGFGDYEDLMAGVDTVLAMGVAHPDSLAVMGWSYGGYMTSYVVTRTDRFKAASMGAGLPNLISMVTTTDIPDYLVAHMGAEFWEDYATYEKHSAIYHIANVTTPTQVLHGAEDRRVPTAQGQEFYVALKRRGVPTEFVLYPRTPHGPREPKLLMDVTPRILAWFDRHLGRHGAAEAAGTR